MIEHIFKVCKEGENLVIKKTVQELKALEQTGDEAYNWMVRNMPAFIIKENK